MCDVKIEREETYVPVLLAVPAAGHNATPPLHLPYMGILNLGTLP